MSPILRVAFAFMVPILLVLGGTLGYAWIEGWSLWESLYMTVITITTVGYGEVHPLSPMGQRFTVLFLMFSFVAVGYSVTTVISFVFEGQIVHAMRERRMKRMISNLKDHYIICGAGVVGKEVAQELKRACVPFVIVDKDPARSELGRDETALFVAGHAEDDEVLVEAGIHRAKGLIAVLREDALNVFVVLSARQANPDLTIVARAAEERTIGKLMTAGADRVMSPYQLAGRRIASVLLRPSIVDFLDVVVGEGEAAMRLEQFPVCEGSSLVGKQLKETEIGQRTGAIVVGIQGPDGKPRVDPAASAGLWGVTIHQDNVLIALGSDSQLNRLKDMAEQ
ncbi:MAG: NAD-binding protein [Gemmatimonadota bacterium]|nr:NAD-binding protein [Gemmatimonadota bacterium]